jgi:hypothetical protein
VGQNLLVVREAIIMDVEVWMFASVPILAGVAAVDALSQFSNRLSSKVRLCNPLFLHVVLLIAVAAIYYAGIFLIFDTSTAFMLKYYVRPQDHWISIVVLPHLFNIDVSVILVSIILAIYFAIKHGLNIVLSIIAAIFGNVGTILWMIRRNARVDTSQP